MRTKSKRIFIRCRELTALVTKGEAELREVRMYLNRSRRLGHLEKTNHYRRLEHGVKEVIRRAKEEYERLMAQQAQELKESQVCMVPIRSDREGDQRT